VDEDFGLWTKVKDYGIEYWFHCHFETAEHEREFTAGIHAALTGRGKPSQWKGATLILRDSQAAKTESGSSCFVFCALADSAGAAEVNELLKNISRGVQIETSISGDGCLPPRQQWPTLWPGWDLAVIMPATRSEGNGQPSATTPLWPLSVWREISRRFLAEFPRSDCYVGRCTGIWWSGDDSGEVYFDESLLLCLKRGNQETPRHLLHFVDEVIFGEWAIDQEAVYISDHLSEAMPRGRALTRKSLASAKDTITFYDTKSDLYYNLWGSQLHWGIFQPGERRSLKAAAEYTSLHSLSLLDLRKDDVFVDLACGAGASLIQVADKIGCTSIGMDCSAAQLRHAESLWNELLAVDGKKEGPKKEMPLLVRALAADRHGEERQLRPLPFRNKSVSKILCQSSLYYFHHKQFAIREVSRCLRPGGLFVFDDMLLNPGTPSRVRFDIYKRQKLSRVFSLQDYQRALSNEHLEIIHAEDLTPHLARSYQSLLELLPDSELDLPLEEADAIRREWTEGFQLLVHAAECRWTEWWLFVCRQRDNRTEESHEPLAGPEPTNYLACPFCLSSLKRDQDSLECSHCRTRFPKVGHIWDLLGTSS
jgi:SAM-dependent methyltransferase